MELGTGVAESTQVPRTKGSSRLFVVQNEGRKPTVKKEKLYLKLFSLRDTRPSVLRRIGSDKFRVDLSYQYVKFIHGKFLSVNTKFY